MSSTLRTLGERLIPEHRRSDISVAAYCTAFGAEPPEEDATEQ